MIHVGQYHEAGVPLFFAKRSCGVFLEHNFKVVEMTGTWRTPRRRNINILWLYFPQQQQKKLWLYCTCPYNINILEAPSGTIQQNQI
jgi:hypothetical protein